MDNGKPCLPVGTVFVVLASLWLLSACTTETPQAGRDRRDLTLSFVQQRVEEGTRRAELRVENRGDEDVPVTAVGLEWPGYGGAWTVPYSTTVQAGFTLDLRMRLPSPACDASPSVRAIGLVETDGAVVRSPLTTDGQRFLVRTWRRACAERLLAQRVSISYGDRWRQIGTGEHAALLGTLEIVRRSSTDAIRITGTQGSVLFDLRLDRPVLLPASQRIGWYPVRLVPARCESHALGQSTQSFLFRVRVQFGRGVPLQGFLVPSLAAQSRARDFLAEACG